MTNKERYRAALAAGMTQKQIAERYGVSKQAVSQATTTYLPWRERKRRDKRARTLAGRIERELTVALVHLIDTFAHDAATRAVNAVRAAIQSAP